VLRVDYSEGNQTKSIKIIKDKDEKPKGFGYVEFHDLEALKEALLKTGSVRLSFRGIDLPS
jgi:translation initiation factor 4B